VTPPNYAPGLFGLVTMDDVVREVLYDKKWIAPPVATSFANDVLPLFQRLTGLQWVNHGLFVLHGFGSTLDAQNPAVIAKLKDNSPSNAAWRQRVFELFRDPNAGGTLVEDRVPQIFGDGIDTIFDPPKAASGLLAVTRTQYAHLTRWVAGNFAGDGSQAAPAPCRVPRGGRRAGRNDGGEAAGAQGAEGRGHRSRLARSEAPGAARSGVARHHRGAGAFTAAGRSCDRAALPRHSPAVEQG
jgi:hypothetical protein